MDINIREDGTQCDDLPPRDPAAEGAEKRFRILIVDDEQDYAQTLSDRLQKKGYLTEVTFDGKNALERLATDRYDVVLLDLNMPGMHGMDVLRRIQQSNIKVQVIIISGYASELIRSAALLEGAFEVLAKPINFNTLSDVIQRAYLPQTPSK